MPLVARFFEERLGTGGLMFIGRASATMCARAELAKALNLLPEIPRHLLPRPAMPIQFRDFTNFEKRTLGRLARELSLGREGVILTMPIGRLAA